MPHLASRSQGASLEVSVAGLAKVVLQVWWCALPPPHHHPQALDKVEVGSSVTAVLRLLDGSGRDLPVSGRGDWSSSCYYFHLLLLLLVLCNVCVPQHSTTWPCQWRPSLTWPRWRRYPSTRAVLTTVTALFPRAPPSRSQSWAHPWG